MSFQRFSRFLPALFCMTIIFWLSATPGETLMHNAGPLIDQVPQTIPPAVGKEPISINWLKVGHFIGYAALGATLMYGFATTVRQPGTLSLVVAVLYATTDEIHQAFVPGRSAGWQDVLLDVTAAGLAILFLVLIQRQKKRAPHASKLA
jgi:VanZ family protein